MYFTNIGNNVVTKLLLSVYKTTSIYHWDSRTSPKLDGFSHFSLLDNLLHFFKRATLSLHSYSVEFIILTSVYDKTETLIVWLNYRNSNTTCLVKQKITHLTFTRCRIIQNCVKSKIEESIHYKLIPQQNVNYITDIYIA